MNRIDPLPPPPSRLWRMGEAEFDEARWELRIGGQRRVMEAKPLALLHALLVRAGEVATKDELMEAVWPGVIVAEGSLPTAVSKLRAALGDQGRAVVEAVHGIGYRIGVPIELHLSHDKARLAFSFLAGEGVPNRPLWQLERPLGANPAADVWLARQVKTGEHRVFKFADTAPRLEALRREVALSRVLHAALGERPDFVRVTEWNFDVRPYFIESPYGGPDLVAWAAERGGIATVPLAERIAIVAQIARTVAAAHEVGILHRDIKPTNVLIGEGGGREAVVRLVDFGAGRLTEAARLDGVTITGLGLTAGDGAGGSPRSGTVRYMPPEVLSGGVPTISADGYALGILLYQMVVGDLDRPLAAGWEADVDDPLLRRDIAEAAAGAPSRRTASAGLLADHLATLEVRRAEAGRQRERVAAALEMAEQVKRARARRPWIVFAMVSLIAGLLAAGSAWVRARHERDEALRQTRIAQAVNHFLTEDLLGRGNPANSGRADETLMEAVAKAEPQIAFRLASEPLIAASLYRALAQAFDSRSAFDAARQAYDSAVAAFRRADGPASADATILLLRRAQMEALSAEAGSADKARALLASAEPRIGLLGDRQAEARVWLLAARSSVEIVGADLAAAFRDVRAAADLADTMPDTFDEDTRLVFRQRIAVSLLRLDDLPAAEKLLKALQQRQLALHGPHHPDTLIVELTLARLLVARGDYGPAVEALDRLYPESVAVFGQDHRQTQMALMERAEALVPLGRYDDSMRDSMAAYRSAVAKQSEHTYFALAMLNAAAVASCRKGDANTGLEFARRAYEGARETFGDKAGNTQLMATNMVFCMVVGRNYAKAGSRLASIDLGAAAKFDSTPDYDAEVELIRAEIAGGTGDFETARSLLQNSRKVFETPNEDPYLRSWIARVESLIPVGTHSPIEGGGARP